MEELKKKIEDLERKVQLLEQARMTQEKILPGVVKNRHLGEGNSYVIYGLEADLPPGNTVTSSTIAYYSSDTNKWWIWNGTAYKSVQLT